MGVSLTATKLEKSSKIAQTIQVKHVKVGTNAERKFCHKLRPHKKDKKKTKNVVRATPVATFGGSVVILMPTCKMEMGNSGCGLLLSHSLKSG